MDKGKTGDTGVSRETLDFIHRENLAHFQTKLARAEDENTRRALQRMIEEEMAEHAAAKGGRSWRWTGWNAAKWKPISSGFSNC